MRRTVALYKALSDPNRLRILLMLEVKPLCVCEIVDILGLANSTVSKHLSILRNADLIMDEKDGRWVNYRLASSEESSEITPVLEQLKKQLYGDAQVKSDRTQLQGVDRFVICASGV